MELTQIFVPREEFWSRNSLEVANAEVQWKKNLKRPYCRWGTHGEKGGRKERAPEKVEKQRKGKETRCIHLPVLKPWKTKQRRRLQRGR